MMHDDVRFCLRLDATEHPVDGPAEWLVGGQWYRGYYEDAPTTLPARRRVRLFHPHDASRSVMLHADQLEPDARPV